MPVACSLGNSGPWPQFDEHKSSAQATYQQSFTGAGGTVVLERKVKKELQVAIDG
jgi:hypothetical protein